MNYGNWGDHIIHELAVKAGAPYGSHVLKVTTEFFDREEPGIWSMEVYAAFHVLTDDWEEKVYYLPGTPQQLMATAVWESTTVPIQDH